MSEYLKKIRRLEGMCIVGRDSVIFWVGKNRFGIGFIVITVRKFSHLLCTFKPTAHFKSQHLCPFSASRTVTTTLCLLQQTPVCTHITCSTHWIMTTADCSVLRYDLLFVQRHTSCFNFRRSVWNYVVCFSLYINCLNFRKPLRSFTLISFQFHGSVHHISINENTNLMQQS